MIYLYLAIFVIVIIPYLYILRKDQVKARRLLDEDKRFFDQLKADLKKIAEK